MAVQETHLTPPFVDSLHCQYYSHLHILSSHDPDHTNSKGIAFVVNKHLTRWKEAVLTEIIPGRAILLQLPWQGKLSIKILAIYAPNAPTENADFFKNLFNIWIQRHYPQLDVMMGDFNLVEDPLDRLPTHSDASQATEALHDFKQYHLLADSWRRENPQTQRTPSYKVTPISNPALTESK
jgi:hypothetical protein